MAHIDTIKDWVSFFEKRGCLFFEEYTKKIQPVDIINSSKKEHTNLFFSICGFPAGWSRKAENAYKFPLFYFDIDLKDNLPLSLEGMRSKLEDVWYMFDFIVQSRNGFHLYILNNEKSYTEEKSEKFLKDWKNKASEIATSTRLVLDDKIFDLSRISRIPGSLHKKPGDTKKCRVQILKGAELISSIGERLRLVNSVPIHKVLDILGIKYAEDNKTIIENGEKTSGYKINTELNYLNDYSHNRYKGEPFAVVKAFNRSELLKEKPGIDEKELNARSIARTWTFFKIHFGILDAGGKGRNIPIPKDIEKGLAESNISGKDIQTILKFFRFAHKQLDTTLPYGEKIKCHLMDFMKGTGMLYKSNEFINYLQDFQNRIPKIKNTLLPMLRFELFKKGTDRMILFSVIPDYFFNKKLQNNIDNGGHFVNTRALLIPTNGKWLKFYLYLCKEWLNIYEKNTEIFERDKEFLKTFFKDNTFQRVRNSIQEISCITQDFDIGNVKYGVIFEKTITDK
ncbi:MAG: hypothetical protein PHQ95_04460 [Candidatus Gracilibacteria bacterium]|nr:hypothetical protein [Candidatus Gracilibacteria bacterium]